MARLAVAGVLLMAACAYGASFTTCQRDYTKLGCFWEKNTNMDLIINDRDSSSAAYQGHMLDWNNFGKSIHSLACRCSAKARAEGYTYFSIRFWAECWAGKSIDEVHNLVKDHTKKTNQCANDAFKTCEDSHEGECVGRRNAEYIYTFAQKAEESLDGGWSDYTAWSECSAKCGPGIQTRERTCTEPEPVGAGKPCQGETTETRSCELKKCPIDGGFSAWSKFTTCTRSCGGGAQERVRSCNNPPPQFGGKDCSGKVFETRSCGDDPCPVDGVYTSWSSFGKCTKTCGGGTQTRTRTCTDPAPAHGGKPCSGAASESKACNTQNCPINGGWSSYGSYGACSKTCGTGIQTQTRTCTNPAPKYGGKSCSGSDTNTRSCKDKDCPINGGWSSYGSYGACSKTCGTGVQTQTRTCTNPAPKYGGKACSGSDTNTKSCKVKDCPINGGWSAYGPYGACSKTCGTGTQSKKRTCTNPAPKFGGKSCSGSATSSRSCKVIDCPINGGWSAYGPYGACSKTCGNGIQTKTRTCTNPAPKFKGKDCSGSATSSRSCKDKECPINGGWSSYGSYGSCSKPCGGGSQTRSRKCNNPAPQYGGKTCSGSSTSSRACNTQNCPINGGWSSYGSYGSCTKSCGGGTQTRKRTCTNPSPKYGGKQCSGSSSSSKSCNTNRCATKSDVQSYVDGLINSYGSKGNSDLATTIQSKLQSRYTGHYFATMVYNAISGYDNHAIIGTQYVAIFRKKNHNVVVSWVSKSKAISKSNKGAALSKVTDSGDCYPKNQSNAAWNKLGGKAVMAMVVRHGNGLRGSYNSAAGTFDNYRCKRKCNFWGKNCDHNSSLVIMFGSA